MRSPLTTPRRLLRRRPSRSARVGGLILLYHRIASPEVDPQLLCVGPERFAEHLEVLRQTVQLTTLDNVRHEDDRPRVAITFDDGYADNLLAAAPPLTAHDVPATVFVTTGAVGSGREFWWDELERLLLLSPSLPETVRLDVGDETLALPAGGSATEGPERDWNVLSVDDPSPRHAAYRLLSARLRGLRPEQRDAALAELAAQAGADRAARPSHRALTAAELDQLDALEAIDIGAHTVDHPLLAALPAAEQRDEIERSKSALEDRLGHPVRSFSYPYGSSGDYGRDAVQAVSAAGFDSACANVEGLVGPRTDRFQLPRFIVRDWDGDEFERRLRDWLDV